MENKINEKEIIGGGINLNVEIIIIAIKNGKKE